MARLDLAPLGALHRFLPVANGSFCRLRHAPFRDGQRRLGAAAGLRACPHALAMADHLLGLDWAHCRILARTVAGTASTGFAWFAGKSRVFAIALRRLLLAFGAWISVQAGTCGQITTHALALRLWLSASGASALAKAGRQAQAYRKTAVVASSWLMARSRALATGRCGIGWQEPGDEGGPLPASRAEFISRSTHRFGLDSGHVAWCRHQHAGGRAPTATGIFPPGAVWSSAKAKATARSSVAASRATYSWAASWTALRMRSGSTDSSAPSRQSSRTTVPWSSGEARRSSASSRTGNVLPLILPAKPAPAGQVACGPRISLIAALNPPPVERFDLLALARGLLAFAIALTAFLIGAYIGTALAKGFRPIHGGAGSVRLGMDPWPLRAVHFLPYVLNGKWRM